MTKELKAYLEVLEKNLDLLNDRFKVKKVAIFGSFAIGKQTSESDIDIMVEFSEPIGFFKFIELENLLTKLLKRKVDLVTKKALKPTMKEAVLKKAVYV